MDVVYCVDWTVELVDGISPAPVEVALVEVGEYVVPGTFISVPPVDVGIRSVPVELHEDVVAVEVLFP